MALQEVMGVVDITLLWWPLLLFSSLLTIVGLKETLRHANKCGQCENG